MSTKLVRDLYRPNSRMDSAHEGETKLMRKKRFVQDLVQQWASPSTRPYDITLPRNALEQSILEKELLVLSDKRMRALRKATYEKRMFIHQMRSKSKGLNTLVARLNLQEQSDNFTLDFAAATRIPPPVAFTADEEFLLSEEIFQQRTEQENMHNNRRIAKSFEHYCSTQAKLGRFSPIKAEELEGYGSRSGSGMSGVNPRTPRGLGSGHSNFTSKLLAKRQNSEESQMSTRFISLSLEAISDD